MVKYAQHIERGTDLAWLIYRVSCSAFIFGIGLRVWSIATNDLQLTEVAACKNF